MLLDDVIEPENTIWASLIVFISKKDGWIPLCVDYRRLNAGTIWDSYPIRRIDKYIVSLKEASVFSTLDANTGYWKIIIEEDGNDKRAFVTHHGLFRYKRMQFSVKNAPAMFKRAMDEIFATEKWQFALLSLGDIVVIAKYPTEKSTQVAPVLRLMKSAGRNLK